MKKTTKIFVVILVIEAILTGIFYFIPNQCGSACAPPSIINPLGIQPPGTICTLQCVQYQPGTWFFTSLDILLLTAIIFVIYLIIIKSKK